MERLEELNKRLIEHYSTAWNGMPIFRIVWSEDQMEKRLMGTTDAGIELLHPEVREVPKYRQYIHNKYLLERLVVVPVASIKELAGEQISYEPLWVYTDANDNALPPKWEVTKFVIDTVLAAQSGDGSLGAKYADKNESAEMKEARIAKIHEELFGNETEVGDALAHGEGVAGFHSKMVN